MSKAEYQAESIFVVFGFWVNDEGEALCYDTGCHRFSYEECQAVVDAWIVSDIAKSEESSVYSIKEYTRVKP